MNYYWKETKPLNFWGYYIFLYRSLLIIKVKICSHSALFHLFYRNTWGTDATLPCGQCGRFRVTVNFRSIYCHSCALSRGTQPWLHDICHTVSHFLKMQWWYSWNSNAMNLNGSAAPFQWLLTDFWGRHFYARWPTMQSWAYQGKASVSMAIQFNEAELMKISHEDGWNNCRVCTRHKWGTFIRWNRWYSLWVNWEWGLRCLNQPQKTLASKTQINV